MNVAFVNRTLGMMRGGGEIWDLRIAEGLEEMGVNVTFYIGSPLGSEPSHPVTDFECVKIPTPQLKNLAYRAPIGVGGVLDDIDTLVFARRAAKRLVDTDHDIIHVNSDPQFGRYTSWFDRPVVVKMNGPPHSLWQDYLNPFSSSYDFFEKFDAVIATGVTTKEIECRRGVDVHTINPGVNTDQFTPDFENSDGKKILFVGRFVPAKNLTALIQAFKEVRKDHPTAELVLIGDGPLRGRIESEISNLELEEAVTLTGYVDNAALPKYYQQASVFALSSRTDNHPITLLEAMSCGTAVVAPKIGWIPNIVDHDQNGLLWKTQTELKNHLSFLLSNMEICNEFGKEGRKKAVTGFDWKQRAKKLLDVYVLINDTNQNTDFGEDHIH